MPYTNQNNNIKKFLVGFFTLAVLTISILSISSVESPQKAKFANAAVPPANNTSNLIIGTSNTSNSVELSVCVQATSGTIHLANASTWFQFDTTALTPTSGLFLEKGRYNGTDGYGQLKWNQIAGALSGNSDKYTMNIAFSGDGISVGQSEIGRAHV